MTPAPTVAAIIVNYRTAQLTIDCVESLLRSTGVAPCVIIIDNASGDDDVSRLHAHLHGREGVSIHARPINDGYTGGNNAGIELARAAGAGYAFVINSDTTVAPDCLEHLVGEMDRDRRTALAHPRIFHGHEPDLLWFGGSRFSMWTGHPVHIGLGRTADHGWDEPRDLPYASGCALLIRLGDCPSPVFDASLFGYAEDLDLSIRVRVAGKRIRYVPDALVWHYEGSSHRAPGGQSLRFYLNTRNLLRIVGRHARWYHWPVLAPMLAIGVVVRFSLIAARNRDRAALRAVWRGTWHAIVGRRHAIETAPDSGPTRPSVSSDSR